MNFVYQSENISGTNKHKFFSADQSLISHFNDSQILLLRVINNSTKIFRLVGTYSRDTDSLINFLTKFVFPGNTIITDQWAGYE